METFFKLPKRSHFGPVSTLARDKMDQEPVRLSMIWYHSELSDVPYFPNQLLSLDFFAVSYSKQLKFSKDESAIYYVRQLWQFNMKFII